MRAADSSVTNKFPIVSDPTPEVVADNDSVATKVFPSFGSAKTPFPTASSIPNVRGYEILSRIGSGGMGIVFKARHRDLNRIVAIKMLRGAGLADPEIRERFHAEAEAVARLQHPNIIQVFEVGTVEPQPGELYPSPFIALEFVDGGCLSHHTETPQQPRSAAQVLEKLARAVQSAHQVGVIHRDLKPSNVLLTREGEPKVADFGLAKLIGAEHAAASRSLTQAGMVMGTPEYMAPEQAAGGSPTAAIDIYSLGVILYELLTGSVPFRGATPLETMTLAGRQEPVSPRRLQPGLPRDLETICLKCLEKEPSKRYASAQDLADDLQCFLEGRTIRARRVNEIEKVARWCRRNPLLAVSLAGIAAMFLTAFVMVSRSYWRAETARQEEARQRQEAERKEQAERWERYRANCVAAASALQVHNVGGARRMLEAAPEEYRNWEWRHFHSRLDGAHHVMDGNVAQNAIVSFDAKEVFLLEIEGVYVLDMVARKRVRFSKKAPEWWGLTHSQNGRTHAYSLSDHSLIIKDVANDRIRSELRGHEKGIHSAYFTADASRLVTRSADRTVRVWDCDTGKSIRMYPAATVNGKIVDISPDGRRVATIEEDDMDVRVWDLDTGKDVALLTGHKKTIAKAQFDSDGKRLVTVEQFPSNTMRLWNVDTGDLIGTVSEHTNTVRQIAFSHDGSRIATCSMDQTIQLWNGVSGKLVATLKGHNGWVNAVAFSPDGKRLVSASQDQTVRLWDGTTGECLAVLNGHTGDVFALAYSPDGKEIVSASKDSSVRIWNAALVESNGILKGHRNFVYSVAFHPDGERVASASWDGTACIWSASTGRKEFTLDHGEKAIVTSVAFHPAGKLLASRERGAVRLWDVSNGKEVHRWPAASHGWQDTRLAFSPDGHHLATGGDGSVIHLWDVNTRAEVAVLRGHRHEVRDLAFSPDGRWLASAAELPDNSVRIWDVATRETVQILEGHSDCAYALAFNADGRQLASGSADGTIRLWDTSTWQLIKKLEHGTNVYGVAFTKDGTRLACASADNSIRLWDMKTYLEVAELRGHTAYVHALAFSPFDDRLVTASGDRTVRIWDTVRLQDRIRAAKE